MLNFYFYNNFLDFYFFKKKKTMFLLSLVSELYYLITNISFINFRNIPFYFFNNKVSKIYKNKLFFFIKFNYLLSIINSFFFLEHSFKI